jgi:hypothetical protein
MKKTNIAVAITIMIAFAIECHGVQKPPQGLSNHYLETAPNRIEVRFAVGEKTIICKEFHILAKTKSHEIISGKFASGFQIPPEASNFTVQDSMELELRCKGYRWHFPEVSANAFTEGYWWVGTSYPPFLEEFKGAHLEDAAWISYLLVRTKGPNFNVYKKCPKKLKNQKNGICYKD